MGKSVTGSKEKKSVLVAMSGGVDSSVTAALLQQEGYDVVGVTMKLIADDTVANPTEKSCCGFDSTRSAKVVADILNIPHYTLNVVDEFQTTVIDNFIAEYKAGKTPNPCVRCNEFVKFDYLIKKMDEFGCNYLATGHYAKIIDGVLYRGDDTKKDQSYFLYCIYKSPATKILFPLGTLNKPAIRKLATDFALPVATRKESQDICFIPDGDYANFLRTYVVDREGPIINEEGATVGSHQGIHKYTIGQRRGIGAHGKPMFVTQINPQTNTIVIGGPDFLFKKQFDITNLLFETTPDQKRDDYEVQVRYNTRPVKARIEAMNNTTYRVFPSTPVKSAAPGQSAVIYDGDRVLGGGIITDNLL